MSSPTVRFCEGAPARFVCPVCADAADKRQVLVVDDVPDAGRMMVYRCGGCACLVYHPAPGMDYTAHTSNPLSVRDYIEFNGAIALVAENILAAIPEGRGPGRLVDIGCGYGFGLDAVRGMLGWEVLGFEPSAYGALGRTQLGLDIVHDFAALNTEPGRCGDVVHCSEVIEHIGDPHGFATILASWLAPEGVLVLTTPDAARIGPDANPSSLLSLLSPGAHTIIFSVEALAGVLRAAGLAHVEVVAGGPSMRLYASRVPLVLERRSAERFAGLLQGHLQTALRRAAPGSPLAIGLRYRLFRHAMDNGDYALARTVFAPELAELYPSVSVSSIDSFAARWPFCIAASTYYRGMLALIGTGRYGEAARYLDAAHRLCRIKLDLAPAISVEESDLVWRAVYHHALALSYLGDKARARAVLARLEGELRPNMPADLPALVAALRASLAG